MSKRPGVEKDISASSYEVGNMVTKIEDAVKVETTSDVKSKNLDDVSDREASVASTSKRDGEIIETSFKNVSDISERLMSTFDYTSSLTKTLVQEALKTDSLEKRSQTLDLRETPLNAWDSDLSLSNLHGIKVVSEVPSIVKFKKISTLQVADESIIGLVPSALSKIEPIANSAILFSSNTNRVTYYIDTENTFSKITYDPEKPTYPGFNLESYVTADGELMSRVDANSSAQCFGQLLRLILEMRKQGDVYVKNLKTVVITDQPKLTGSTSYNLIRGRTIPARMLEHISLSLDGHPLLWFRNDVINTIKQDDVIFGEYAVAERVIGMNAKKSSYYGVATDHIFATLHNIFMREHDAKRTNAVEYCNAIKSLAYPGSTIIPKSDLEAGLFEIYQPNKEDTHRYIFMFFLSPSFRNNQFNYLSSLLETMGGIRQIIPADRLHAQNISNLDPNKLLSSAEESLLRYIKGYTIAHFRQMMVMELSHRFHNPTYSISSSFNTPQDACFSLLMIALDALIFPNMFWTNLHIYSSAFYSAWQFLAPSKFDDMLRKGYTKSYAEVRELTRGDILSGEIPRAFEFPDEMPENVKKFVKAIRPRGVMFYPECFNSNWCSSVDSRPCFYIPFEFRNRDKLTSSSVTPIYYAVSSVTAVLKLAYNSYISNSGFNRSLSAPISQLLTTIAEWSRVFGSVCHFEIHAMYRMLANGPEIPSTTYRGLPKANVSPTIGIGSTEKSNLLGIPSIDTSGVFYTGIGLWALSSIIGEGISAGMRTHSTTVSTILFPDPGLRYHRYIVQLQQVKPIVESFGVMSYILDAGIPEKSRSLKYLIDGFGASLKSGIAAQILDQMLEGVSVRQLLFGKLASRDVPIFIDQRLYAPRITLFDKDGNMLPPSPDDTVFFKNKLILLNSYAQQKLDVVSEVIAGTESPFHRYVEGIVVANTLFKNYSPENRHPIPNMEIEFNPNDDRFGLELFGDETMVYVRINNRKWNSPSNENFPTKVRVKIIIPTDVPNYLWSFLETAVSKADWQLYFPEIRFIATVSVITKDMGARLSDKGEMSWHFIKNLKQGQVEHITLYDSTGDIVNNRLEITRADVTQMICTLQPVERNIVVKGIAGFNRDVMYSGVDDRMWTIGKKIPEVIPRTENNQEKYRSSVVNFNNFIKVYTSNVEFTEAPPYTYLPPIGLNYMG